MARPCSISSQALCVKGVGTDADVGAVRILVEFIGRRLRGETVAVHDQRLPVCRQCGGYGVFKRPVMRPVVAVQQALPLITTQGVSQGTTPRGMRVDDAHAAGGH